MTVSVIIPCYNAAATVAETIGSVLDQQAVSQVIAIDDGSKDATAEVLKSFGDRIQAVYGPNRGVSAARNQGIALATGDWIQFLDSDDLIEPDDIARRLAEVGKADALICDWQEFTEENGRKQDGQLRRIDAEAVAKDAQLAFAGHAWAPPAAVLYRADLVRKVGGFNAQLPVIQDARFLFDIARAGGRFVYSPHLGARYRIVPWSLSRRNPQAFWGDLLTNGKDIENLWRGDGPLTPERLELLGGIYNQAGRGLFNCGGERYFEAVEGQRRIGVVSRHARLATPLAKVIGLGGARALLGQGRRR